MEKRKSPKIILFSKWGKSAQVKVKEKQATKIERTNENKETERKETCSETATKQE
jgi:hypothetical protein